MDKEGFDTSSSAIDILQKPLFPTRNASQKRLRKAAHLVRATPREEGSTKPNTKLAKRPTVTGTKNLKGHMCHEREDRSCNSKKVHFSSGRVNSCEALSNGNKDLHAIIHEKITVALDCKEKKDLNKFEALSILSDSNKDNGSNSNSRVINTSNEGMDSE
jgi:hypothetical protein